jgi:hypothetical protein
MKKENIEYLKKFETNFNTAIKSNFSRAIPTADKYKMQEILLEEKREKFPLSPNCALCTLKLLKKVGELYFNAVKDVVELETQLNINKLENKVANMEQNGKQSESSNKGKKKRTK